MKWIFLLALPLLWCTESAAREPPPARQGFQMSHQLGLSVPWGRATGASGDRHGGRYNWQWELLLIGVGVKVHDNWYVGGYGDFTFGGRGGDSRVREACRDNDENFENDIQCGTVTLHTGVEMRFDAMPARRANLWVGYGIGPIFASQMLNDQVVGRREETSLTGWEYARLSTGVTFRLAKPIGLGPYIHTSVGEYLQTRTTIDRQVVHSGKISDRSLHFWTGVGLKVVLFP